MSDCLFCRIRDGEVPASIVYRDDQVIAFEDINPMAPVHTLLIPTRHIESVLQLGESEDMIMGELLRVAAEVARMKGVADDGFRLVTNVGVAAGQTVQHLHFHLLAGRDLGWPPG